MGKKIGIDTSIFIYLLEESPEHLLLSRKLLRAVEIGKLSGIFSCIGVLELLTGLKKQGRADLVDQYKFILANFQNLTIVGIDADTVDIASDLRAKYALKTPDAIHVATAISEGAKTFVTNDKRLKQMTEIDVKLLSEIV